MKTQKSAFHATRSLVLSAVAITAGTRCCLSCCRAEVLRRSCGHIFCSDCCDKKRKLELYEVPQRVCNDCGLQIANHNRKQQIARLDADLVRVSSDHLIRM